MRPLPEECAKSDCSEVRDPKGEDTGVYFSLASLMGRHGVVEDGWGSRLWACCEEHRTQVLANVAAELHPPDAKERRAAGTREQQQQRSIMMTLERALASTRGEAPEIILTTEAPADMANDVVAILDRRGWRAHER